MSHWLFLTVPWEIFSVYFIATSWIKGLPTLLLHCWDVLFYLDISDGCSHPGVTGLRESLISWVLTISDSCSSDHPGPCWDNPLSRKWMEGALSLPTMWTTRVSVQRSPSRESTAKKRDQPCFKLGSIFSHPIAWEHNFSKHRCY